MLVIVYNLLFTLSSSLLCSVRAEWNVDNSKLKFVLLDIEIQGLKAESGCRTGRLEVSSLVLGKTVCIHNEDFVLISPLEMYKGFYKSFSLFREENLLCGVKKGSGTHVSRTPHSNKYTYTTYTLVPPHQVHSPNICVPLSPLL